MQCDKKCDKRFIILFFLFQIIPLSSVVKEGTSILAIPFSELQIRYTSVNWTQIFPNLRQDTIVRVTNPNYFYGMDRVIGQINDDTIKLYILITVILQGTWQYLPYDQRTFIAGLGTERIIQYDWLHCVNFTYNLLPSELHQEYTIKKAEMIELGFDDVKSVISNISNTMAAIFTNSADLSTETQQAFLNILSTLKTKTIPLQTVDRSFAIRPSISFLLAATECLKKRFNEDMARIGTLSISPVITWSDLQSIYDERTNTIGSVFIFLL